MTIRSFSGAHAFRPQCVVIAVRDTQLQVADTPRPGHQDGSSDLALAIVRAIDALRCPRCKHPLAVSKNGARCWMNAGSRETRCRCIPICSECGTHEALQPRFAQSQLHIRDWPTNADQVRADLKRWKAGATPGKGTLTVSHLLTDDGVSVLRSEPDTGGWRQFGFSED